ncbi:hypothetical protein LCGC14_2012570 [marine sediment metagenome]|uniref:Uncharacterized protein n=1 Tax=marine sediment metagenome TaxID=412755 RepID=A0A0F9F000_9ZZZZ
MIYKIVEISTVLDTSLTYVLVEFWLTLESIRKGDPPLLTNDFLMQLQATSTRIITNGDGWLKTVEGIFIDPNTLDPDGPQPEWELETVPRDVPAEIKGNIEDYEHRASTSQLTGNHTADASKPLYKEGQIVTQRVDTPLVKRDQSDPKDILAKTGVQDLIGAEIEVRLATL